MVVIVLVFNFFDRRIAPIKLLLQVYPERSEGLHSTSISLIDQRLEFIPANSVFSILIFCQ